MLFSVVCWLSILISLESFIYFQDAFVLSLTEERRTPQSNENEKEGKCV